MASSQSQISSLESDLEVAKKKETELKAKLQKLKDERDTTKERLESESTNVAGTLFFLFYEMQRFLISNQHYSLLHCYRTLLKIAG